MPPKRRACNVGWHWLLSLVATAFGERNALRSVLPANTATVIPDTDGPKSGIVRVIFYSHDGRHLLALAKRSRGVWLCEVRVQFKRKYYLCSYFGEFFDKIVLKKACNVFHCKDVFAGVLVSNSSSLNCALRRYLFGLLRLRSVIRISV
jgi:hypothetical protein